jgi:NADP-dependent 3-hydroxy acid dehydrogenase YdfG
MAPTDTSLKRKVAIVTGASSGIGADICRELSQWSASVVLVGRDASRLDAHRLCVDVTETLARFGARPVTSSPTCATPSAGKPQGSFS